VSIMDNGITVPCFVCCTPNASIRSELLAQMLKHIDDTGIFSQSEEEGCPFLLIDGHQSRTMLPFLRYVNHPDHLWWACIGVHMQLILWHPHDSLDFNGTFKIKLYKTKQEYLKERPYNMKKYVPSDIILIINRCWPHKLGNKRFARNAISQSGWFPLNYALLNDPRLICVPKEYENDLIASVMQQSLNQEPLQEINMDGPIFNCCVKKIIVDHMKSVVRLETAKKQKEDNANRESVAKNIRSFLL
jgi:hypothetical protein